MESVHANDVLFIYNNVSWISKIPQNIPFIQTHFLKSSHCLKNMLRVELFSQVYSFFIIRATTSISWVCVGKYRFRIQRPNPLQTGNNRKTVGKKRVSSSSSQKPMHQYCQYFLWKLLYIKQILNCKNNDPQSNTGTLRRVQTMCCKRVLIVCSFI